MESIDSKHEVRWVLDEMRLKNFGDEYLAEVFSRRKEGEPLAYIFGHWQFRDLELEVSPGVLIPRPETEELVDLVLDRVRARENTFRNWHIVDAGAGSGCLGISLHLEVQKKLRLRSELTSIEVSEDAAFVLSKNLSKFAPDAKLFRGSWMEWASSSKIQILVSNPPYISGIETDKADTGVEVWEPHLALYPNDLSKFPDASGPYRELIKLANHVVDVGGIAAFELGPAQAEWIDAYVKENYPLWSGELLKDMSAKWRFFIMQRLA